MNPDKTPQNVTPNGGTIDGVSPPPQGIPGQTAAPSFQDIRGLPLPPAPQPNPSAPIQAPPPVPHNNPFKETTITAGPAPTANSPIDQGQTAQPMPSTAQTQVTPATADVPVANQVQATSAATQTTPIIPNNPLKKTPIETPRPTAKKGWVRDIIGLGVFITVVIVGAWLINMLVFRSFNVVGPSMEPTLEGENGRSDRLIVNLLPVTGAHIAGKEWVPSRGQIIVFKNPKFTPGSPDEYIVKRVIGLPGERVTVTDCVLKVHNSEHPNGFNPYPDFKNFTENDAEINTCVEGAGTDVTVPDDQIFVVGDHRVGIYSMDSRDGGGRASLGTIPLDDIIGPVALRIWPIDQLKIF
ncbi:signal peptidase I [Candidatus Saccharibacteria bacterium]|nr:signal peptidase I [Candidatus Saccharibacteria bacterium]